MAERTSKKSAKVAKKAGAKAKPAAREAKPRSHEQATGKAASRLIDQRIRELGGWRGETLARMRALILEADPEMIEEWKWMGTPVWSHHGIVCTGESYTKVVKLTFARGASIPDPSRLFNSSLEGNTRRAIDIREGEKVDAGAFKALVRAAVTRNGSPAKKTVDAEGRFRAPARAPHLKRLAEDDQGAKEQAMAEADIRRRVEDWAKALRTRDVDAVMSLYAPDIVSFDLDPPLRYTGTDRKRRAWQEFFAAHTGPIAYEVRELRITTHGELAFVHSLNHVNGTLASGHISDLWVRWTACFRRIDGVWLIAHDHVSVPADLKRGQAILNLTP
jgi:uncharacterized protein (TIGR02246 family)